MSNLTDTEVVDRILSLSVAANSLTVTLQACKDEPDPSTFSYAQYSSSLSTLKTIAPQYQRLLVRENNFETRKLLDELGTKLRQCASLIKDLKGGMNDLNSPSKVAAATAAPGPIALHSASSVSNIELKSPRAPGAKINPWKRVELFGIVRFDFDGDAAKRQLQLIKGDILFITGEARGWFKGRIVGTHLIGLIPGNYCEALTGEEAIRRIKEKESLIAVLRDQKRGLNQQLLLLKEHVNSVVDALRGKMVENNNLKEQLAEKSLEAGQEATLRARIAELEAENATLQAAAIRRASFLDQIDLDASTEVTSIYDSGNSFADSIVAHINTSLQNPKEAAAADPVPMPAINLAPKMATFGVPLSWLIERDDCSVPPIIENLCEALLEGQPKKICSQGIFRVTSDQVELDRVKLQINMDPTGVDFSKLSAQVLGDLLKMFLRELPEPLLTSSLFERWMMALSLKKASASPRKSVSFSDSGPTNPEVAKHRLYVRALLAALPFENLALVEYLINFLVLAITHSQENGLDVMNASKLFGVFFCDPLKAEKTPQSVTSPRVRSGFTPFFARRSMKPPGRGESDTDVANVAMHLGAGNGVLQMLLEGHREYFAGIFAVNSFSEWVAKKDHKAIGPHDLALHKGDPVAVFSRINNTHSWAEANGAIGEVPNIILKPCQ